MSATPVHVRSHAAPLVVGVDVSTTSAKAIVWGPDGQRLGSGQSPLNLSTPHPGYGEQDPRQWWTAFVTAVREATAGIHVDRIVAISITHQRETFACLDAAGEPVRPAMLWLDVRAARQVEQFGSERVHALTGKPANPTPAWYKLLWLAEHEPHTLEQTAHIVDVHGYFAFRLTGRRVTSIASADPLGLVDISTGDYATELLDAASVTLAQLDTLAQPGEPIGPLTDSAAAELGLRADTIVIAGAGDGQSAGLGAGVTTAGRAYLNLGTGLIAGAVSDDYAPSLAYRALTGGKPGTFDYELFIGAGTYMVTWFLDTFLGPSDAGGSASGGLEQYWEQQAATVTPGSDGLVVVPYWNGALTPYWDSAARGVMVGFTGSHTRAHIYRAILEGIACELRLCLEHAERTLATPISEFVAMGGGSRSPFWCQLLADVLQRPIVLAGEDEATCLGAGMLATVGAGIHPDIDAASTAMSSLGIRYEPNADAAATFDRLYAAYRAVYPALAPVFPALAGGAA
jgi:xylulokinase